MCTEIKEQNEGLNSNADMQEPHLSIINICGLFSAELSMNANKSHDQTLRLLIGLYLLI